MTVGLVAVDAAVWAGWSLVVGTVASRLPEDSFALDSKLTRLRRFERGGRVYERSGIRRWKGRVPEFGAFGGGRSKRTLPGRDAASLCRFAADTRRAEYVHWAIAAATPLFALWNPPALFAAMLAYGVAANLPFIAIQRYNRARLARIAERRAVRAAV